VISPDSYQAVAVCTREQAETLVQYDHHRVKVENRWGIMITYPWMPIEVAHEPLEVKVLFNPAFKYGFTPDQVRAMIFKHPLAPEDVQTIINQLQFIDAIP
jgi:hypothetical protein